MRQTYFHCGPFPQLVNSEGKTHSCHVQCTSTIAMVFSGAIHV